MRFISASFALVTLGSAALATTPTYNVIRIDANNALAVSSSAYAISGNGAISGQADFFDGTTWTTDGFLYANGQFADIVPNTAPGALRTGIGVNNAGDVAVYVTGASVAGEMFHAGVTHRIPAPPNNAGLWPAGLNASGVSVGVMCVPIGGNQYQNHAFSNSGNTTTDLNSLFGRDYSDAHAINDAGVIVGETRVGTSNVQGFILNGSQVTLVGSFGGGNSVAYSISPSGQFAAGGAYQADNAQHAFVFTNGVLINLGVLANGAASVAQGVNDSGVAVGFVTFPGGYSGGNKRAFLFSGDSMHDLNDLIPAGSGWVLKSANAINNAGQIVGSGTLNGATRAFLLTPASACPADLNGDHQVDLVDVSLLLSCYGSNCNDVDGDGVTGLSDLSAVLAAYGTTCP